MKAKKQTGLWIVIAFLSILAIALTGITFAWFTDKVTVDDFTLNFGKIELETSSTVTSKELPYTTADIKLTRGDQTLEEGSYAMPGDKVEINITVKLTENSQPAYYLVYFDGDDLFEYGSVFFFKSGTDIYAVNGAVDNLTLSKVGSDGTLTEVTITEDTHIVGSIKKEDTAHEISFVQQIDLKATEADLSGSKTFSCTVYAIQQANMTEKEAYDEIYKQANKSVTFGTGAVITTGTGGDITGMTALPSWKQAINDYYKYETISFYKTGKQPETLRLNETLTDFFDKQQEKNNLETGLIKVYTNGTTELAFVSDYKIMAPANSMDLFGLAEIVVGIVEVGDWEPTSTNYAIKFDNFYTDDIVQMGYYDSDFGEDNLIFGMFGGNYLLTTLDLSRWDTSKVENMSSMFYGCSSLTTLDLSNWDLKNCSEYGTGAVLMECMALQTITAPKTYNAISVDIVLSDTKTGRLYSEIPAGTEKGTQFKCWGSWENLDYWVESWANSLEDLVTADFDVNWKTKIFDSTYVSNIGFNSISSITKIQFLKTAEVPTGYTKVSTSTLDYEVYKSDTTTGDIIFATSGLLRCSSLSHLFDGLTSLSEIHMENFKSTDATDASYMFANCSSLTNVFETYSYAENQTFSSLEELYPYLIYYGYTGLNLGSVTNMSYMFYNCGLTELSTATISLSPAAFFSLDQATNTSHMFDSCSNLKTFYYNDWKTSSIIDASYMFANCSNLTGLGYEVVWSGFKSATNLSYMFYNCSKLSALDLYWLEADKAENMSYMFAGCSSLTKLITTGKSGNGVRVGWNTSNVTTWTNMFQGAFVNGGELTISNTFVIKGETATASSLQTSADLSSSVTVTVESD